MDEVRSPVIFYERSGMNDAGELLSGQLWAELEVTAQGLFILTNADGAIDFMYGATVNASSAVVGVSPGTTGIFTPVDISTASTTMRTMIRPRARPLAASVAR